MREQFRQEAVLPKLHIQRRIEALIATLRVAVSTLAIRSMVGTYVTLVDRLETIAPAWPGRTYARSRAWRSRLWEAVQALLSWHLLPLLCAALGIAVTVPALWSGWAPGDDVMQRSLLLSATLPQAIKGVFVFLDPASNHALMDAGKLPWWTLESARINFMRPLAALSLWLDYRLWPNSAFLMHAHSLLWYGALCALAAWSFRRLMGKGVAAGLAGLLFAVNINHLAVATQMNSRNVLQTCAFGLLTLLLHDRWRRGGWHAGAWLAPLCFAITLLFAEAGVGIAFYLAAYALCLGRGRWRERLLSVLPYLLILLVWRLAYQRLGYGAWGSDFYIDPGKEPLRFAATLIERVPLLLFGEWALPDVSFFAVFAYWTRAAVWLAAVSFLGLLGFVLYPLLRRSAQARFWATGALLAVLPACAVNPASGRHLIFSGLGVLCLLGLLIASLSERTVWPAAHPTWRTAATWFGLCLLALQLVLLPPTQAAQRAFTDPTTRAMTDLGALPGCATQDVVLVNAPSPGEMIYVPGLRELRGQPLPAHLRILAAAHTTVTLTRIDEWTLAVRPEHGYLIPPGSAVGDRRDWWPLAGAPFACQVGDVLFRSRSYPLSLGTTVSLSGFQAIVTELTPDGRPQAAQMRFSHRLEDASLRFLQWDWSTLSYIPFALPAVGETVTVAGPF
jgi:hypothetical protein